jgi:yeast amino acid transporter
MVSNGPSSSLLKRFVHSFDRHPNNDGELTWALEKGLKGHHSQFIALGSAIGTGLFIGSGQGLAAAGPIPLLAAFSFVGITLCPTVFALGEMATLFPLPGGFFEHCRIYTDEAWGGAMGWKSVLALHNTSSR